MKRKIVCLLAICFTIFLGASYMEEIMNNQTGEVFDVDTEPFLYEGTKNTDVIAVDEAGYLYATTCITELDNGIITNESDYVYEPFQHIVKIYDLDGNCVKKVKLCVGNGKFSFLVAKDNLLYGIAKKFIKGEYIPTLYRIDVITWEITELFSFCTYKEITNFAKVGDYFYVIGKLKEENLQSFYNGMCISRIQKDTTGQQEILSIECPMDIVSTNDDTLLIYYDKQSEFGFLELDPVDLTLKQVNEIERKMKSPYITECENGFLYLEDESIFYGETNGTRYVVVNRDVLSNPTYQKGFAFYLVEGGVERMGIFNMIEQKKKLYILKDDYYNEGIELYDKNYRIKLNELSLRDYTNAILEQHKEFDMYLVESRCWVSYKIKEKGQFYTLNEVEGVQEYLDACFPYVKETATNEDGEIWMIPVELSIPILAYHKEYCEEQGIDLSTMNFSQFLTLIEQVEEEATEQGSISTYLLLENFFWQYLSAYDNFNINMFKGYANQIKQLHDNVGIMRIDEVDWVSNFKTTNALVGNVSIKEEQLNKIPNFFYSFFNYIEEIKHYATRLGNSDKIGISGIPKVSKDIGNVGTLLCIAVNPKSKNLDLTLDYISDFCKYMMQQKDSFLLADESTYTDTPFIKECYEVYKNGAVFWEMDSYVYWNPFWDYIEEKKELAGIQWLMEEKLQEVK